ncbi:PGF-pre-PGF domain-containing protein [Candidatus Woesearchaeota archaeon]|jgi:PGF-pre-PGF domain-containing protein|nr:PGF-pre-PGF domain-containing protein [Candidatus Woesearchaeota archaeon]MBT4111199.1 PGF-pre-PGF domain-containing protein [Candidatus Woesearchaeota archaeon]MBT4336779.1 PGF-pre-PGF domain-containing protein [Candidatus Woesearchaeota archaeon]MBT4469447.1 PGF-pre-PGF domain-containing protein [Candidatus Woesearchaeota archaeon]MBT6744158.1 PGF-pre-PGF domain-containing protein [Candidatus Woesearchaeota archaeon]
MNFKKKGILVLFVLVFVLLACFAFGLISSSTVVAPVNMTNYSGSIVLNVTLNQDGSNANNITNVTFRFQALNGSFVYNETIWNNTLNDVKFDNNQSSLFDTSILTDGMYKLMINMSNVSGALNMPSNYSINITVDNTVPVVTINTPAGNFSTNTFLFNVTATDALVGMDWVRFNISNGSSGQIYIYNSSVANGNYWNFTLNASGNLSNNRYNLTILANDTVNNVNSTTRFEFVYDTIAPAVTQLNITGNSSNNLSGVVLFNVTATDGLAGVDWVVLNFSNASGSQYLINITAANGSSWNISYGTANITDGHYNLTVYVNDTANNINESWSVNRTFWIDNTAPTISFTSTTISTSSLTIDVSTNVDAASCTSDIGSITGTKDSWTITYSGLQSETSFTFTVVCTDEAGNARSVQYTESTASSSGGGNSGSSGGIGTGAAGLFAKEVWASINSGETATVEVDNGEIGVTEVNFKVDKTIYGAWLKVEKKTSLPSNVKTFSNKVYKNVKITENNVQEALEGSVTIDFKVTKAWLKENKFSKNNVAMFRYVDEKWVELKTTLGSADDTYQHYTAETPGFSYFVIGQKEEAAPLTEEELVAEEVAEVAEVGEEVVEETTEEITEEITKEGKSTWPWVALILVVIAVIVVAYWLMKRK